MHRRLLELCTVSLDPLQCNCDHTKLEVLVRVPVCSPALGRLSCSGIIGE